MRKLIFIAFAIFATNAFSQINTAGLPIIKHYPKSVYGAGTQNWSICQDSRGFLYFANNNGLLRYDGNSWDLFPLPNNQLVRSVYCSGDTIFVGAFEEIGYFVYHRQSDMVYHSLISLVPKTDVNFDEAWRIFKIGPTYIFQTFSHILEYSKGEMRVFRAPELLQFSFVMRGNYYVQGKEGNIYLYQNGSFDRFNDNGIFNGKQIWACFEISGGKTLLATINHGVWIFDGIAFTPWKGQVNDLLKAYQVFSASRVSGGYIAFGTIQNGLIITDNQGNLVKFINKSTGLQNNTILSTFVDNANNLWLGLDNGIDYIELNSPLSFIGEGLGLEGAVYATKIFDGKIFVGTNQGLYVASWPIGVFIDGTKPFRMVPLTKGQVWSLFESDGKLYCGHNFGTFVIDKGLNVRLISPEEGSWMFLPIRSVPDLMIVGKYKGLHLYSKANGEWRYLKKIAGFNESSRLLVEDDNESIWMAHGYKGIFKLMLNQSKDSIRFSTLYDNTRGFPGKFAINVEKIGNQVVFLTPQGVYRYNSLTDNMEPYQELNQIIGDATGVRRMVEDEKGNIWILKSNGLLKLVREADGTKRVYQTPVSRFGSNLVTSFENIYVYNHSNIFIGTENGLVYYSSLYNPELQKNELYCAVKSISSTGKHESVIFNDYAVTGNGDLYIPFNQNSIRVTAAAPVYNAGEITFSFLLKGYDTDWSPWQRDNAKDFSQIPYGEYNLMVRVRDAMGRISEPTVVHIQVGLPWYFTWYAFILYLVLLVAAFYTLRILVRRKVQRATARVKEQKNLELKVKEEEHKRQVLEAEREIIRLKTENLQVQIEHKNRELAAIAMQIAHKNDFLNRLRLRLEVIAKSINPVSQKEVLDLIRNIDNDLKMDKEWQRFEHHFDEVHSGFIKKLKELYPELTPSELRLCAYLRLNMTTKDIAQILNISVRGVEISRYRLRKKLKIESDTNLVDFMLNL
ncbi:MAG: LuxR C-terminal-related transcriptional regulator [Tenuifilum sp.]|uniref:LuxR C-terminal-related transcriptional regulator n=1 Tax=Tenuifilum sp. TaxID=2760880 RepID=UPI0030A8CB67